MPTRLYIGNLDPQVAPEKEDLERKFSKYGELVNVWVSRQPAGFAFVTFEGYREALKAIDGEDGSQFEGRRMSVQLSVSKGKGEGGGKGGGKGGGGGRRSRSPPRRRSPSRRRRSPPRRGRGDSRSRSPPRRSSPSYGRGGRRGRSRS
mmetsp:Transcript_15987/g.37687  ORF Transcript_15987/g.37687 Transcript_15987/m.37687 type:complete len:148 (-) Transcript_15987:82-525(-)